MNTIKCLNRREKRKKRYHDMAYDYFVKIQRTDIKL